MLFRRGSVNPVHRQEISALESNKESALKTGFLYSIRFTDSAVHWCANSSVRFTDSAVRRISL